MKELRDRFRNFPMMRFKCKMSGVVEAHFSIRNVSSERIGTSGHKERIVSAPRGK